MTRRSLRQKANREVNMIAPLYPFRARRTHYLQIPRKPIKGGAYVLSTAEISLICRSIGKNWRDEPRKSVIRLRKYIVRNTSFAVGKNLSRDSWKYILALLHMIEEEKEHIHKLYQCVKRLSQNLTFFNTTIASETVTTNPKAMWGCIGADVLQVIGAARECPSSIDCSVVHELHNQVCGAKVKTIENAISEVLSIIPRLDLLAGSLGEYIRVHY